MLGDGTDGDLGTRTGSLVPIDVAGLGSGGVAIDAGW